MPVMLLALLLLLLGFPDQALAWGPGVHMAIGNQFLHVPHLLPQALASVLAAQPHAFLYGCLSADIFVGKGCTTKPGHSHNWDTARILLLAADSPPLQAHALGYVSHLAADVVAHNYYVPTMLGLTPGSGKLSHMLVEMQADRRVRWSVRQARGVLLHPHLDQDSCLLMATKRKRWPFQFKKRLFINSVRVSGSRELRKHLSSLRRMLPLAPSLTTELPPELFADRLVTDPRDNYNYLMRMLDLSLTLSIQAVTRFESCLAQDFDPIGGENLREVRRLRRKGLHMEALHSPKSPGTLFPLDPKLDALIRGGTHVLVSGSAQARSEAKPRR